MTGRTVPPLPLPLLLLAWLVVACASPAASTPGTPTAAPSAPTPEPSARATASAAAETAHLVAAGDIADCTLEGDSATAAVIEQWPDAVVAAIGDLVYPNGTAETYAECYLPTWGAFLDRTRPAAGNHDLAVDGGTAFWDLFGDRAGARGEGWYSYDLGAWHVMVLNSNCERIGCGAGSPQHDWLLADLAASGAECIVAYWHHPRFTSGMHGDEPVMGAEFWSTLADAGAELVLTGHDHHYERFMPMDGAGSPAADGMRQFIVGTGGGVLRPAVDVALGSELIIDDAHGVLLLTLGPGSYAWAFIGADGAELDSGAGNCSG